jgi:hypothetical protein
MTITCTNFDIKNNHQDVLDILGADYDYSERSTWNNTAVYHLKKSAATSKQSALEDIASIAGFDILIK